MGYAQKAKRALENINRERRQVKWKRVGSSILVALAVGALFCAILYWLV